MTSFEGYLYRFCKTLEYRLEPSKTGVGIEGKKWIFETFPATFYQIGVGTDGVMVAEFDSGHCAETVRPYEFAVIQGNLGYYYCWSTERNVEEAIRAMEKVFMYHQQSETNDYADKMTGLTKARQDERSNGPDYKTRYNG